MSRSDVPIMLGGASVGLSGSTRSSLDDLRAALSAATPATRAPQMRLHCCPRAVTVPSRRPDQVVRHVARWQESDHSIVAVAPDVVAEVRADSAVLDPGSGGARAVHALLLPVLTLLFAERDQCLVHAAGLLQGGTVTLVLGGSGQGKSSLITAALSAGYSVLSDDLLVLTRDQQQVSVSGVPQPLALPADLVHEAAVGRALAGDGRNRRAPARPVPLDPRWHRLGRVVLVEHSADASGHLRPATGSEVLHRLLASSLEGLGRGTARRVFPYAAAVARAPAWHLGHAADPAARVPAAVGRLERTAATAG